MRAVLIISLTLNSLTAWAAANALNPEHYLTLRPTQIYESELLTTGSGYKKRGKIPGSSNGGYIDFVGEGYIEWTVFVPGTSDYDIVIRYALGRGDRSLAISVDGEVINPALNFAQTGPRKDWSVWTDKKMTARLPNGLHVIRATTTGRNGPNIDFLRLDDIGSPAVAEKVPDDSRGFGQGVTGIGDINGDGFPDIVAGAYTTEVFADSFQRGQVTLHSGLDGSLIDVIRRTNDGRKHFGLEVVELGDVNGDGVDDFCASTKGLVTIYSGADRNILNRFFAPLPPRIANVGDIDGDSIDDIAVGSIVAIAGASNEGRVYVISGATAATIRVLDNPFPNLGFQLFGSSVTGLGDVNGDGTPDILVGADQQLVEGRIEGRYFAFSGASGDFLYDVDHAGVDDATDATGFARNAKRLPDITGDSIDDFIVGSQNNAVFGLQAAGQAFIFSGADGSLHRIIESPTPDENAIFGQEVAALPDLNMDGFSEYAVRENETPEAGTPDDVWYFYSGADGSLLLVMDVGLDVSRLEVLGDLNNDGVVELGFGGDDGSGDGALHIYSFQSVDSPSRPDSQTVVVRSNPYSQQRGTIDLRKVDSMWVAIMSQDGFDPVNINLRTVSVGALDANLRSFSFGDRNTDGVADLILRYKIKDAPLDCGEQDLVVTGMTHGGVPFNGILKLNVFGCR